MRGTFRYGVEVLGLGEVEGYYTAVNGEIESIELPDGEECRVWDWKQVKHDHPVCKLLGDTIYAHLLKSDKVTYEELPQTITPEYDRRFERAYA